MSGVDRPDNPRLTFHGRRRGHRLRRRRQGCLDALLPRLRIPLPAEGGRIAPADLFSTPVADVWLEIGFGGGEHLAAQAGDHPDVGFIGCEPFVDGVAALATTIDTAGLRNIRLFDDDARRLLPSLTNASIGRVFLLFSDPWPKRRHHKRRFPDAGAMAELERIVRPGGEIRFATDHTDFAAWFLERMLRRRAFDWLARCPEHWRQRPEDGHGTRYEAKATAAGKACVYLAFKRHG